MTWLREISDHYSRIWMTEAEECGFSSGPINELTDEFSVLRFQPHSDREMWTYATAGMSTIADDNPVELHLFSPYDSSEIVEALYAVAHYHRTACRLDLGHSINFGRPWIDKSLCQFGLVSLPYLDGPKLGSAQISGREVKFFWLIPVTKSEVEFKKACGLNALEEALERAQFDYLDPQRLSVI